MVLPHWSKPSHLELDKWSKPFICLTHTLIWQLMHVLFLALSTECATWKIKANQVQKVRPRTLWFQLCCCCYWLLLWQSWGQYKARIQILGHMYMAGSTIVVTLHNHILLIFRYKQSKLRFTIDYSPFCSGCVMFLTLLFCQLISLEKQNVLKTWQDLQYKKETAVDMIII